MGVVHAQPACKPQMSTVDHALSMALPAGVYVPPVPQYDDFVRISKVLLAPGHYQLACMPEAAHGTIDNVRALLQDSGSQDIMCGHKVFDVMTPKPLMAITTSNCSPNSLTALQEIMRGRTPAQQKEVVLSVLDSLMPPGAPQQFRCAARLGARLACDTSACHIIPAALRYCDSSNFHITI